MKINYILTLLLILFISGLSFGQGAEPFTNSAATSSYADGSFVGYNLRNEGYQIFTASNGLEAIKLAKKHIPHLISIMSGSSSTNKILISLLFIMLTNVCNQKY